MFFTRSIRRKMVLGLALVLVMLMTLSLSGISGLISYRNVVNNLDFSINKAPKRTELLEAVSLLYEPLLPNIAPHHRDVGHKRPPELQSRWLLAPAQPLNFLISPVMGLFGRLASESNSSERGRVARGRRQQFAKRLTLAKERVLAFRRKLDNIPPTPGATGRRPVTEALLADVDLRLIDLERHAVALGDNKLGDATAQQMLAEVAHLQALVQRVPDPEEGLNSTLQQARRVYRSRFWIVSVMSAVVVVLFLGLVRYGYLWIFVPIRKLHQGALRVAQGDFHYRVELHSHDEMAELADAFNRMTARFCEITDDLDRQVRERSKQLVRSERLAGVGFLAAGVAHEINNPLSAIVLASDSLQDRMTDLFSKPDEEETAVFIQYLQMIGRESQRCRQITAKLLDFSRGQDARRGPNDLTSLISEVLSMVRHMSKFRDREIVFSHSDPCYAEVNGPEIKQVILNLVANSLESMQTSGTLQIDIAEQTDHVMLTFADDGIGMTQDVLDNLFEPFFTQRQGGKGTGLGLSISHRIVSEHGGTIEVSSDGPGKGSTFRIHLPRKAAIPDAAA